MKSTKRISHHRREPYTHKTAKKAIAKILYAFFGRKITFAINIVSWELDSKFKSSHTPEFKCSLHFFPTNTDSVVVPAFSYSELIQALKAKLLTLPVEIK